MRILVIFIFIIGLGRGLAIVVADPVLAVANNYDMIRVQACIGAYPIREASMPLWANSYEAPLERYQFAKVETLCFVTSEVLFAIAAAPAMWAETYISSDDGFSIRWIGIMKLLGLVLIAGLVSAALLARSPRIAASYAAFFAVVVCDPAMLLYLNTFYAEFSVIFFAYLLLSILVLDLSGFASEKFS